MRTLLFCIQLECLLEQTRKACRGQTLQPLTKACYLWTKKFYNIGSRCQCLKTFFVRTLQIFVISYRICQWQASPAKSNVCGQGQDPVLPSGRLLSYPQTLDLVALTFRDNQSSLLQKFVYYGHKKFHTVGTLCQCCSTFLFIPDNKL